MYVCGNQCRVYVLNKLSRMCLQPAQLRILIYFISEAEQNEHITCACAVAISKVVSPVQCNDGSWFSINSRCLPVPVLENICCPSTLPRPSPCVSPPPPAVWELHHCETLHTHQNIFLPWETIFFSWCREETESCQVGDDEDSILCTGRHEERKVP